MIKMTLLIARKPGMSVEEFREYWGTTHLKAVASVPESKVSRGYRQQHNTYVVPDHTAAAPFDGIAEAWYDSIEDAMTFINSDGWWNIIKRDDLNFIDITKTQIMLSEERRFD
ncbi:EthD domain-containing protein [Rhizosaccharibacter radicis]|uniref:EthD domain-containing protein n=1 Tax=Rhizosaccharibacter radicis TaxID=2782605 RepID=A0ABT1VVD5_9PROT|nr:EthD domain-containing protein [Acetobacteraceae bacterium KSS12]